MNNTSQYTTYRTRGELLIAFCTISSYDKLLNIVVKYYSFLIIEFKIEESFKAD